MDNEINDLDAIVSLAEKNREAIKKLRAELERLQKILEFKSIKEESNHPAVVGTYGH